MTTGTARAPSPPLRSIASGARPLVLGRLASMGVTFALPLVLARLLDAAAFGSYKQLFLVAQTVLLVGQLGLTQSLFYFLPRGEAWRSAFVSQALVCLSALGLLAGGALALLLPSLAPHLGGGALGALAVPAGLLSAGLLLAAPLEGALTSEGHVALSALCYLVSDGTRAALLLGGARAGGLHGLAWAAAAWAGLRVLALAVLVLARRIPLGVPRRGLWAAQLSWALPVALSAWLAVAQRQFVQYAVAARFDAAAFALFSVAAFHVPVVDILYTPVGEVLMVELGRADGDPDRRWRAFRDAVARLAEILWPASACALLFGPRVLRLLFGARYAAAAPLFLVTSVEIPLWVLPVESVLRALGRTRFLSAWYALRQPLTALLVLGGIHLGGLEGAIAGAVASEAVSRLVLLVASRRALGPAPRGGPRLSRLALATAAAALPALLVEALLPGRAALPAGITAYGIGWLALRRAWPV